MDTEGLPNTEEAAYSDLMSSSELSKPLSKCSDTSAPESSFSVVTILQTNFNRIQ